MTPPKLNLVCVHIETFDVDVNPTNDPYYERMVEAPDDIIEQATKDLLEAHSTEFEQRVRRLMMARAR
ncbi:hypothetical protein [Dyella sp. ASV21]|uniref:hypothetical protein n=1 Tax=Dyella sp. ASV21 TaxID=2795114 RepID=UPI0018EB74D5|nr:hypothetical protein [Dyella sp. ASV21]